MNKSKSIKLVGMADAMPYATDDSFNTQQDILLLENLRNVQTDFEALRLGFMAFCFCTKGSLTMKRNGVTVVLQPGDLLIGIGEQVYEDPVVSDDFESKTLLISHQCAADSITGLTQMWQYLLYIYECPVLHLSDSEYEWVQECFREVKLRLRAHAHAYYRESLLAMLRMFYFDICDLLSHRKTSSESSTGRTGYRIFDTFIHLLGQHFREERSILWYSQQMCITSKYLSEVVKEVSGKTAGQWISSLVVMEIKMLLTGTSLSVKEIAARLSFPTQGFLGKYFKNATGLSPSEYRYNWEQHR